MIIHNQNQDQNLNLDSLNKANIAQEVKVVTNPENSKDTIIDLDLNPDKSLSEALITEDNLNLVTSPISENDIMSEIKKCSKPILPMPIKLMIIFKTITKSIIKDEFIAYKDDLSNNWLEKPSKVQMQVMFIDFIRDKFRLNGWDIGYN